MTTLPQVLYEGELRLDEQYRLKICALQAAGRVGVEVTALARGQAAPLGRVRVDPEVLGDLARDLGYIIREINRTAARRVI